jgi:hypothetical protein
LPERIAFDARRLVLYPGSYDGAGTKTPVRSLGGFEALVIVVIAARKINMDLTAKSDPS